MKEQVTIHYAHCIKYTMYELDRYPFSQYEHRQAFCEYEDRGPSGLGWDEHVITLDGRIIANEESETDARSTAAYNLMCESRVKASGIKEVA